MSKTGKLILKIIVFLVGFAAIFLLLQQILHYRWSEKDDLYSTNLLMQKLPEESFDVMFFGTSEIKYSVFPTAIYEENGITSFNYTTTYLSGMTAYYQLKYALQYQKPKVVCCDFQGLFQDTSPDVLDTVYHKVSDTMPDKKIKWELIHSIYEDYPEENMLPYLFPMLQYHDMWSELTPINFEKPNQYDPEHPGYAMGCELSTAPYEREPEKFTPQMWDFSYNRPEPNPINAEWYEKFITLCQENDIQVMAYFPPAFGLADEHISSIDSMTVFLELRGVHILDDNKYESVEEMGLTQAEDFSDYTHTSYRGALKVSRRLAQHLREFYELPDHRGEKSAIDWEQNWKDFCIDYGMEE